MGTEPYIYDASRHQSWGNRIGVMDWGAGKIEGHLERKPRVGDHIHFTMQSGKVMDTVVTEVQTFADPPDQFFATVKQIGYVDDERQREYDELRKRREALRAALTGRPTA